MKKLSVTPDPLGRSVNRGADITFLHRDVKLSVPVILLQAPVAKIAFSVHGIEGDRVINNPYRIVIAVMKYQRGSLYQWQPTVKVIVVGTDIPVLNIYLIVVAYCTILRAAGREVGNLHRRAVRKFNRNVFVTPAENIKFTGGNGGLNLRSIGPISNAVTKEGDPAPVYPRHFDIAVRYYVLWQVH